MRSTIRTLASLLLCGMTASVQEYNKRVINLGILCSAVCDTVAVAEYVTSLYSTHFLHALAGSRQRPRSEPIL